MSLTVVDIAAVLPKGRTLKQTIMVDSKFESCMEATVKEYVLRQCNTMPESVTFVKK